MYKPSIEHCTWCYPLLYSQWVAWFVHHSIDAIDRDERQILHDFLAFFLGFLAKWTLTTWARYSSLAVHDHFWPTCLCWFYSLSLQYELMGIMRYRLWSNCWLIPHHCHSSNLKQASRALFWRTLLSVCYLPHSFDCLHCCFCFLVIEFMDGTMNVLPLCSVRLSRNNSHTVKFQRC